MKDRSSKARDKVLSLIKEISDLDTQNVNDGDMQAIIHSVRDTQDQVEKDSPSTYQQAASQELKRIRKEVESLCDGDQVQEQLPLEDLHDLLLEVDKRIHSLSRPLYPLVGSGVVLWNPTPEQQLLALYGQLHVLAARYQGDLPAAVRNQLEALLGSLRQASETCENWDLCLRENLQGLLELYISVSDATLGPDPEFVASLHSLVEGIARAFWIHEIPQLYGPINGHQEDPVVAGLESGGWVIAWEDHSNEHHSLIRMEVYGSDGKPTSGIESVAKSTSRHDMRPAIIGLPNGEFVIAYEKDNGVHVEIYANRYNSDGKLQGTPIRLGDDSNRDKERPCLAALSDGQWVATWHEHHYRDLEYQVFMQRFDSNGQRQGNARKIRADEGLEPRNPLVTAVDDCYVILFQSRRSGRLETLEAQVFDCKGSQIGSFEVAEFLEEQEVTHTSIQGLGNETFVVAWQGLNDEGSGSCICCQQFSLDGDPLTELVALPSPHHGEPYAPRLCATPHGGFVLAWQIETTKTSELWLQRFDHDCDPVGPLFEAADSIAGLRHSTSIAALPDGFVTTWCAKDPATDCLGIHQLRLSVCPLRATSSRLSRIQQQFFSLQESLKSIPINQGLVTVAQSTYDALTQVFNMIQSTGFEDRYYRRLMRLHEPVDELRARLEPFVVAKQTSTQKHRGLQFLRARLKGVLGLLIRHTDAGVDEDKRAFGLTLLRNNANYATQLGCAAQQAGNPTFVKINHRANASKGQVLRTQLHWCGTQHARQRGQESSPKKIKKKSTQSSKVVQYDALRQTYRPNTWKPPGRS